MAEKEITFRLDHIVAGVPTANGRVYTAEVLRQMAEQANAGGMPVLDSRGHAKEPYYRGEAVGRVTRSHFDGECLVVDAMILESVVIPEALDIFVEAEWHGVVARVTIDKADLQHLRAVDPDTLEVPDSQEGQVE